MAPGTCGGLHGHVRVSPDGTAYVPNENCFDANNVSRPGVAVSTDNGLTWTVRTVPDARSINPGTDPSVAALPPHVKPQMMKKVAKAMLHGDEDRVGIVEHGFKGKLAEFTETAKEKLSGD